MATARSQRPVPAPGRRRKEEVRPRYGRISAAAAALAITGVTLLGGIGVLPDDQPASAIGQVRSDGTGHIAVAPAARSARPSTAPSTAPAASPSPVVPASTALPAASGTGRRVVFDISDQRVWLVGADGAVDRTYLVSGSVTDNLAPGSYAVYSRSRWAVGIEDSGVMQYFVRFAHGQNAAIGFHTIPTKDGTPLQSRAQLGTPRSHGCIRQATPDAIALWDFAPDGTRVVVTA